MLLVSSCTPKNFAFDSILGVSYVNDAEFLKQMYRHLGIKNLEISTREVLIKRYLHGQ